MAARAQVDPKISFAWNGEVVEVLGETKVSGLRLRDTVIAAERTLNVTGSCRSVQTEVIWRRAGGTS